MRIEIEVSDDRIEQDRELRILADRYDNIYDLDGIVSICRAVDKYGKDPMQALEEIKYIAFRDYEKPSGGN